MAQDRTRIRKTYSFFRPPPIYASGGGGGGGGGGCCNPELWFSTQDDAIFTTGSVLIRGPAASENAAEDYGTDNFFYVSGSIGSQGAERHVSVFGGDVVVSGSLTALFGLSGSLTQLPDGTSYLIAGVGIDIVSASNGAVTISSQIGGGDVYTDEFYQEDLTSNLLVVPHGLAAQYVDVSVYDENDKLIIPDEVIATGIGTVTIDLSSFTPIPAIASTTPWHVFVVSGQAPIYTDVFWFSTTAGSIYTSGSVAIVGDGDEYGVIDSPLDKGADVFFYVSGSISGSGAEDKKALFGGDVRISGSLTIGTGSVIVTSNNVQFTGYDMRLERDAADLMFYDPNNPTGLSLTDLYLNGGTPGSPVNSVQYNSAGTFAGSANFTYDGRLYLTGSFSQGSFSAAIGVSSHAEGLLTTASADYAHAEGRGAVIEAGSAYAHAEGYFTKVFNNALYAHVEGYLTTASATAAHAEGLQTRVSAAASHAEGERTLAAGFSSHAEGLLTTASSGAPYSHVEGWLSLTEGDYAHAEGYATLAKGQFSHAEGWATKANNTGVHTEGYFTTGSGIYSHAEGDKTLALGQFSHAEGYGTYAQANYSHAEGYLTTGSGVTSHAEGELARATGRGSHAEGYGTETEGNYAHSEGYNTTARGLNSHSEGSGTLAEGADSHAEGGSTIAIGAGSHAEGFRSVAEGDYSHAGGLFTIAQGDYQTVVGKYNVGYDETDNNALFIVGDGTDNSLSKRHTFLMINSSSKPAPDGGTVMLLDKNENNVDASPFSCAIAISNVISKVPSTELSVWGIGQSTGASRLYFLRGADTTTDPFTVGLTALAYLSPTINVGQLDFTGQHRSIPSGDYGSYLNKVGSIVISNGTYASLSGSSISINDAVPVVELSATRNDKRCFGVISDAEDHESSVREYPQGRFVSVYEKSSAEDNRLFINSLGEGAVWVCNVNGNLENGDYITTCEIPGYGMKQDDDLLHNYTVAKITCDCDFDLGSTIYKCEEFTHEGVTYRRAFVGCTYHCG